MGLSSSYPRILILGGCICLICILYRLGDKRSELPEFQFLSLIQKDTRARQKLWLHRGGAILILCLGFLLLSGPKRVQTTPQQTKKGIDISIILDVSLSMEANDFTPNRLESAKRALQEIIRSRTTDRIGVVVFSGKPFISVPLHDEYHIIEQIVDNITTRTIDQAYPQLQGTAIGDAILVGLSLLEPVQEEGREQVILLISDGDGNIGADPLLIARLAAEKNIKIYTLGVGSEAGGMVETSTAFGVRQQRVPGVDEQVLSDIAMITQGTYTRVIDDTSMQQVIQQLGSLHQQEIITTTQKDRTDARGRFFLVLVITMGVYIHQQRRFIAS